jgi:hypothetical protein
MGFYPFSPLLPSATAILGLLAGGTVPGALTVAGALTTQAGIANSGGSVTSSSLITTTAAAGITASGGFNAGVGSVDVPQTGGGLKVAEGANAKQGIATLAAGTVTVANTSVTANSRILLTVQSLGTVAVPSGYCVSARTPGTSFTILASAPTDTSVIAWEIFEPG